MFFFFSLFPQLCHSRSLVVPDSFPTITSAIKVAYHGDTVFVKKGTYREALALSKEVSILGQSKDSSIIACPKGKIGIDCRAKYNESFIKNLKILGGEIGIRTLNCIPKITDNLIVNSSKVGIQAFITCPVINNNVIYGAKIAGIYLEHVRTKKCRINNNVIINSGYSGIYAVGRTTISLQGNIIGCSKIGIYYEDSGVLSFIGWTSIFQCDNFFPFVNWSTNNLVESIPPFVSPGLPDLNYCLVPNSEFHMKYPGVGLQNAQ